MAALSKGLHGAACVLLLALQVVSLIPLCVYYALPSSRPHRGYTLHQTLARKLMYDLMMLYTRLRWVTTLPLSPGGLGHRFVLIKPASRPDIYQGPLQDPTIHPTTISGTWYPHAPDLSSLVETAQKPGKLLLHFHGGGYVIGSGRPLDSGYMAGVLNRHVAPIALFAEYRLSCTSEGRFPAALQDALTAYVFLLDKGIRPENIILSGDSAGGHLVISLLRYLSEYMGPVLPAPSRALLWSPWIDVQAGASAAAVAQRRNYRTDYLPAAFSEWAVASFAPANAVDLASPYITLRDEPFKTPTKLWVHVGSLEVLYDEVRDWTQNMIDAGCEVSLRVEDGAPHDIVESAYLNGFRAEAEAAARSAAMWSRNV